MFEAAYNVVSGYLHPYCNNSKVLTDEETFEMLNLTKSGGHTWRGLVKDINGRCTKKHVFETYNVSEVDNLLFNAWVDKKLNPCYAFSAYLKPELITAEKTYYFDENGNEIIPKTRLFMASDPVHLALCMKMNGDSNKKLYRCHWPETPLALGFSKFHNNGHKLYLAMPNILIEEDVSQMDSSCQTEQMLYAAQFTWDAYALTERTSHLLHKLTASIACLIYSIVILPNGDVIKLNRGNKSGQLNTTRDNTLILLMIIVYDMLKRRLNPFDLLGTIFMILCGDDGLLDAKYFNLNCLRHTFAQFGKRLKARIVKKEEASFCSHNFIKIDDDYGLEHMAMVLPRERLLSSMHHGWKNLSTELKIDRMSCLSIECYPYPKLYDMTQKILEFLNAPPQAFLTSNQLSSLWFGTESKFAIADFAFKYIKQTIYRCPFA